MSESQFPIPGKWIIIGISTGFAIGLALLYFVASAGNGDPIERDRQPPHSPPAIQ